MNHYRTNKSTYARSLTEAFGPHTNLHIDADPPKTHRDDKIVLIACAISTVGILLLAAFSRYY